VGEPELAATLTPVPNGRLSMKKQHIKHYLFPLLLVMYEITIYLSNDMYLPALPDMMRDLHLTATQAQLTITMWFLGSALLPLIMGALADRFGRRKTLLTGGFIFVVSTALCAMAIDEYTLLAARVLEGAMVASMMVAGYACIHELYDHKEAIRVLAIMGGVSVLAPAFGPLVGAFILLFLSWRWIFWIIALCAAIMLMCLYYYMPETLTDEKRHPLHLKKILSQYWQVVTNIQFLLLMSVLGCIFGAFIAWVSTGPLLVIESLKFSAIAFGWMQAAVFIAYIFGSHVVNVLMVKHDAYRLIHAGLVISIFGGVGSWLAAVIWPEQFYLFLLSVIVFSFGSALCFAPLNRLIIETSEQPMGSRVAMFTTGLMIAGTLGSAIASVLYDGSSVSLAGMMAVGVIMACGLQIAARYSRG